MVHVPTPVEEDRRQVHRELLFTRRERGRHTNRIKGLLASQGVPLAGLGGTPFQSGDVAHEQGISKAGNRWIRALAIQTAWGWLRFQPESALSQWYMTRFGHGSSRVRKIGIVALARKLLIAFWRYLETGVVPEGAMVRT